MPHAVPETPKAGKQLAFCELARLVAVEEGVPEPRRTLTPLALAISELV